MKNTKQVIVMRKDLKMRRGKECAQAAHASIAFLTKDGFVGETDRGHRCFLNVSLGHEFLHEVNHWLENSFRKICVYVSSEEELLEIYKRAKEANLIAHLIEDNGATEFNGVKTLTCCAIGPHWDESFKGVTDHLTLL